MAGRNLELADDFAKDYDGSVSKNNWIGPAVIFDLLSKHLLPVSNILDLGIGTGESSVSFYSAGHKITGIDGSKKMLEECKKKNLTETLILFDLEKTPFPTLENTFDAVISNGVFHLIHPISQVFKEVKCFLKSGGFFAFTFDESDNIDDFEEIESGIFRKETISGVYTFKYSKDYIFNILKKNGFLILNENRFLAFQNIELKTDFYFTAILAKLSANRQQ
jgi:predicted TPR repeat methyltransferase